MRPITPNEGLVSLLSELHHASEDYLRVRTARGWRAQQERKRTADLLAGCFSEVEEWLAEQGHDDLLREIRSVRGLPGESSQASPS